MGSRPVRELIINSLREDPQLAEEVYNEAVLCLVRGESEVTKILLRDLIHATVGFEAMAVTLEKSPKSLYRMLSNSGNPKLDNLSAILYQLARIVKPEVVREAEPA
jgi:DNA-binding phage protein